MNAIVASTETLPADLFNGFDFEVARAAAMQGNPEGVAKWEQHNAANDKSGIKGLMTGRSDTFVVSFFDLHIEADWNSRDLSNPENLAHIEWLSHNIPENGQKEAIEVRVEGNKLWVRDGHCRYFGMALAMKRDGWKCEGVKVVTTERGSDKTDHVLSQILRNSGKRLSPIETAVAYQKLIRLGMTAEKVALKVTKSVAAVNASLTLLEADPEVKALVVAGKVSATEAAQVVKEHGPTEATRIITESLTKVQEAVKAEGGDVTKAKVTRKSLNAVQGKLSPAKQVQAIRSGFKAARIESRDVETNEVTIKMSGDEWDKFRAFLDL
jgi:hypothetical protein